jgi:hypothetical protein
VKKALYGAALLLALMVTLSPHAGADKTMGQAVRVDFSRDIRPILAANCFSCHGQDPTARQANLRLDTREGAIALRNGNQAIVPGKPEKSTLVARINAKVPALLMPPAASGHRLTATQKTLLTQWIRQGAPYATHWAFVPLKRPAVPVVSDVGLKPPSGSGEARLRGLQSKGVSGGLIKGSQSGLTKNQKPKTKNPHPIDAFVLARLQRAGLTLAPEADRATLIRRVSLDLTGLPPSPTEVQNFLADRSPNAYEKVVERLLASPRYGEHWARMWLDLARYADTQGYEKDQPRTIWRYRDWVIDALNADMPYDRFTIEQLAGDLLPNATDSQRLATAFHRNTMTNTEGGVDGEEFRVAAVKDRVDTTMQVWMGLTMGCAKCHTHKYDPLTQKDYYSFYALFNQTEDANRYDEAPTAPMPSEEQKKQLAAVDEKLKGLREAFWKETPERAAKQREWEQSLASGSLWTPLRFEKATADSGATLRMRDDGAILVSGTHKDKDTYTLTFALPASKVSSLRLEALKDPSLPNGGPGRDRNDANVVTSEFVVELIGAEQTERSLVTLQNSRADFAQGGWPIANALDGNPDTGWAWAPQNGQPHVAVFDLKTALTVPGGKLVVTIKQNYPYLQHGCFRISVSGADATLLRPELRSLSELAAISAEKRTPEEKKRLDEAYRQTHAPTDAVWRDLSVVEKERAELAGKIPSIPVMKDLPSDKLRVTKIHQRGNFLDPGETVAPAIPEAFGPLPSGAPLNRLGAAEWLVSRNNPLTARVTVNRFWARLFGTGLVETEEDFGTQGTFPTHPELLDWLAVTFQDDLKWSQKHLLKTIVMSATYRQAGTATPIRIKADPRNMLFSRGPRFRLPAEVIRDQALAVSGLLSAKMHGPSVMPPQPDGLWKTVYSGMRWQTSAGEDRYRRALYTFWRRTSPYPSMTTFDAGSGEFCIVRRVRTNTPLQALVTLNDPAFVEAAGALGKAMLSESLPTARDRIVAGFRRVLSRPPTKAETTRLEGLYNTSLAGFRHKPDSAKSLLGAANVPTLPNHDTAEQAAYTVLANVLLNLDETLTKP